MVLLDLRQAQRLPGQALVLAMLAADQAHHLCQASEGFLAGLGGQAVQHATAEGMVERAAPGRAITAETDDDR